MTNTKLSFALASLIVLSGCNSGSGSDAPVTNPKPDNVVTGETGDSTVLLSTSDVEISDEHSYLLPTPGLTRESVDRIEDLKSNFGYVVLDKAFMKFVFQLTQNTAAKRARKSDDGMSDELKAAINDYQFIISYRVDGVNYKLSGHALPQLKRDDKTIVPHYVKLNANGGVLTEQEQAMTYRMQEWACVTDNKTNLTWQVLQPSGVFAFDSRYYWGDRVVNHRDFGEAQCSLGRACNTAELVAKANEMSLCGKTDWRIPTKNEWKSLLTTKMFDEQRKHSPIDSFFFPFVDANFDEAYWTNAFTQYPNGHDADAKVGDWQGSNSTVGDAYVMWMGNDFADERMPPRSTNEPWFAMLISGDMIIDDTTQSKEVVAVELKREVNKAGDEDAHWQNRFSKIGAMGQPIQDQTNTDWVCTQDKLYQSELPTTQILWQRVSKVAPKMTYSQAEQYVEKVNAAALCGHTNWRLPSENELKSLLVDNVAFDTEGMSFRAGYTKSVFDDTVVADESYYWTQTQDNYFPDTKHMAVAFQKEWSESSGEDNNNLYRVRLISTSVTAP
ncbi:DUF1566 domain-containing protein [Vibrio sp. NTOU-M3]|uniref:Lcl domain-containing protein n=1 Tax=Vibrio sp. NTOU-M3 TaxID=3234954 RepID=UPI00349F6F3E